MVHGGQAPRGRLWPGSLQDSGFGRDPMPLSKFPCMSERRSLEAVPHGGKAGRRGITSGVLRLLEEPSHLGKLTRRGFTEGLGEWHPTPVLLPGKSHGWRSLVGCSPRGCEESDTTERLHFHFSLSCIGEGNGNPLQCSCLEDPRGGGAWWAAVYGVAQSRTRLKRLSSSSSSLGGLV